MVLLPIGALRRSMSPGHTHCEDICLAGFSVERGAEDPTATRERGCALRWAELQDVLELSETEPILGEGASGTVRSCTLRKCGGSAAVKIVPKGGRGGAQAARGARQEAETLRSMQHLNVCRLLDAFEDDSYVYLVLEHINGGDLFEAFGGNMPHKPNEDRVAAIAKQLFEALQYCCAASVIHRDLKLENVMLASAGDTAPIVKIVDFGLASRVTGRGGWLQADVVGTKAYMAPETLAKGIYSSASDMWSTGVLLHVLLTGALPEHDGTLGAVDASDSAKDLLCGLLRHSPSERLTAEEAGKHPWLWPASSGHADESVR